MLLESDGAYCLYDGGPGSASSKVVAFLQSCGISKLDYMIASHYDEDHISGLIGTLHNYSVDTLIVPDYQADTAIYQSFLKAVDLNGVDPTYAVAGNSYPFGTSTISVLMPLMPTYDDENDYSVAIRVSCQDTSIIITGDCSTIGEGDMILAGEYLDSDILVAGHHGSSKSTSQAFLDAVTPTYAVVSCGVDNTYAHPSKEVMQRLQANGISVFRTDTQEDILLQSDGDVWQSSPAPSDDYSYRDNTQSTAPVQEMAVGEPGSAQEPASVGGMEYALNTNTMRFHYTDCNSVFQMNPKNLEYTTATRDELIARGYIPCGNCKP